ncbi:MAG: hypothetical protein EB828_04535 [Nitrosopumilus sp. D6]|nr:MAG: hypothetical protein EB828_04535 [Nitrosopumilus sp. D6]
MADQTEIKIIRDEMLKLAAEIDRCHSKISEMHDTLDCMTQLLAAKDLEIKTKDRIISYYENPHSPPSQNSILI